MYLFTRAGRVSPGHIREAMTFIGTITEKVQQETGLDVHAWSSTMSPDLGTTVWATFVDDLEHLEAADDKLAASDSYLDLAEKGSRLFAGAFSDGLAQVVSGELDPSAPLPSYVTVARATAANGQLGAAMTNGVEIAEAATRITGVRTMFLVDATGAYGGCRWTSGFADIAELQRAEAALNADDSWLALIDRVGTSYAQDAHQAIYRKIT
ncbi:MAG TPA: hypothetical protein VF015_14080 [Acidimicrobiales bacterium]